MPPDLTSATLLASHKPHATYQISAPLARAPLTSLSTSDTLSRRPVCEEQLDSTDGYAELWSLIHHQL